MRRFRMRRILAAVTMAFGCSAESEPADGTRSVQGCRAGDVFECACVDGRSGTQLCNALGTLGPCECGEKAVTSFGGGGSGGGGGAGGASLPEPDPGGAGTGPVPEPTGTTTTEPPPPPDPTGTATTEPPPPPPPEPPPPEPPPPDPTDPFDALRQVCVDHINEYRATLGLEPLERASNDVELCSDSGAEQDAVSGDAHSSYGQCPGMGAQNTCPGWNPQFYGGEEGALLACLDAMWAEGEPAEGRSACIADRYGCFLEHGHYLNMSKASARVVSCGFYRMASGEIWMNQDFGD